MTMQGVRERPALDLSRTAFSRILGSISVHGAWLEAPREAEGPCLVLTPSGVGFVPQGWRPCVVPLREAWRWTDLGDEEHQMRSCFEFCAELGLNPLRKGDLYAVMTAIRDSIGDLYAMPPRPERPRAEAGVLTILADGEVVDETPIMDDDHV